MGLIDTLLFILVDQVKKRVLRQECGMSLEELAGAAWGSCHRAASFPNKAVMSKGGRPRETARARRRHLPTWGDS